MTGEAVGATSGRARLLRASALAGVSLLLASGAHVVGGGHLPGTGVLLVAATLLGMVAALVTARRCRFGVLALLLAGQQVLLHTLFTVASSSSAVHLASGHHAALAHGPGLDAVGPAMDMPGPGWAMWVAHAVATLATAWLLARGEAWLWRAADRVVAAAGLVRTAHARRTPAALPGTAYLLPHLDGPAWRVAGPRGPPAALVG